MSKSILDYIELLEESLVSLTEAPKYFPGGRPSRASLERWVRRGVRGVKLQTVIICGRRYTSREGIDRFIRAQLQVEPQSTRLEPVKSMSKTELAEATRKYNLPEPD